MHLNVLRTGLVFGVALGLWHAVWATLVAAGVAQWLIEFVLRLHFLSLAVKVAPFNLTVAGMLVGFTFVVGFAVGIAVALIWNALHADIKRPEM